MVSGYGDPISVIAIVCRPTNERRWGPALVRDRLSPRAHPDRPGQHRRRGSPSARAHHRQAHDLRKRHRGERCDRRVPRHRLGNGGRPSLERRVLARETAETVELVFVDRRQKAGRNEAGNESFDAVCVEDGIELDVRAAGDGLDRERRLDPVGDLDERPSRLGLVMWVVDARRDRRWSARSGARCPPRRRRRGSPGRRTPAEGSPPGRWCSR